MAIVEDVKTATGSGVSQIDVLSVVSQGNDRTIFVEFQDEGNRATTSVTFDPGGANEKAGVLVGEVSNVFRTSIWRIDAPAAVTATVRIVFNGGTSVTATATAWSGVDQTTPNDAAVTATGGASPATVDVASEIGDRVLDSVEAVNVAITVGGGQTQRSNQSVGEVTGGVSTEPGAGTVTMSWTFGATDGWEIVACNVNAAAAIQPVFEFRVPEYA